MLLTQPKSCPRLRGKCRGVAVTKGERLGDAEHCEMFPLSLFAIAHRQLPRRRWSLLVRFTSSHIKPALKGEVDMSVSEWTEGLHQSCCCLRQPLSRLRRQLPGRGAFWCALQALIKILPHRGRWILRSKRRREFAPYRASSILFKNSSSGAKRRLCSLPLRRNMSVCEAFALSVLSAPARVKGMPSG